MICQWKETGGNTREFDVLFLCTSSQLFTRTIILKKCHVLYSSDFQHSDYLTYQSDSQWAIINSSVKKQATSRLYFLFPTSESPKMKVRTEKCRTRNIVNQRFVIVMNVIYVMNAWWFSMIFHDPKVALESRIICNRNKGIKNLLLIKVNLTN